MIEFLLKGLMRDRSRSLFPFVTVVVGVMLTVFIYCWLKGAESNFIESSAKFNTGHVKIMSRAYAQESDQTPNDLAYVGTAALIQDLNLDFPDMIWTPRIKFGGLLDIPDEQGETRSQGPVVGLAVDLFSGESPEWDILNLENSLVRGQFPDNPGEIVISEEFAQRLGVQLGETATLISSTLYGSMAMANFTISGTIRFGITAMDRGAMLADFRDIQVALDMQDASGEILGFFSDFLYHDDLAQEMTTQFNDRYKDDPDEFLPVMETLSSQGGLGDLLNIFNYYSGIMLAIFIFVMSIVLWNAGLMGSLRRYGEIGVRLAIGEDKGHLYRSMIAESLMIGFLGTIAGTAVGLLIAYYLQVKGIDFSSMMKNSSLMVSDVWRTKITPVSFVIGFIPGLFATFLGTSISGIGIYRRQTSQLMKELET